MSSSACLLAFLTSALASALASKLWMALPRLMAPVPVTFAFSASKPPVMLRFFATWAAATHWPRFLNPSQAVAASSPVSVLILPAMAVLWLSTVLGEACDMSVWLMAFELGPFPLELPMPGPWPAGGPAGAPPWPCWANAGRLNANDIEVRAVIRTKCLCFTDSSCDDNDRHRAGVGTG